MNYSKMIKRKKRTKNMSWEDGVRKVIPYVPGEQPKIKNIIKLNTNECPYPPAPGVQKKADSFSCEQLRLYPDPDAADLTKCLADYYKVREEQVFVGVGSDDVLAMAFLTFFNSEKPILFPDITYSFYDVWADLYRIPYKLIPLKDDFSIDAADYNIPNGGIVIANPNAPTGLAMPLAEIEKIILANQDVIVIVDEAYVDFGGESAIGLLDKYENLLVVQTFSKSRAMAGMRIGFAIGNEKVIQYLKDAKFSFNSYTMNRPSIEMGVEAVRDDVYFKETCNKIVRTRERVKQELKNLGFTFPESSTNFIFATHKTIPAKEIFEALKKEGIFVRYFNKPRIDNHLRITIGTDDEMDKLITFLKEFTAC